MEKHVKRKTMFYGLVAILLATTMGTLIYNFRGFPPGLPPSNPPVPSTHSSVMATFPSINALKDFLQTNSQTQGPFTLYGPVDMKLLNSPGVFVFAQTPSTTNSPSILAPTGETFGTYAETVQHSVTNVQVAGIDEADTVKVDDNGFMYTVSGDTVYIIDAYPPPQAQVLSKIKFDNTYPFGIFVSGDRLVVLASQYTTPSYAFPLYRAYSLVDTKTFVRLYDITDRSNPQLLKEVIAPGSYFDSRMIGDYLYFVTSEGAYTLNDTVPLPQITQNGEVTEIPPTQIHYFNGTDEYYQYTTFVAMNVQNTTEAPVYLTVLLGGTSNMYVSQQNMYVSFQDSYGDGNTTIYRIRLQGSNMMFEASGKVPGQEKNQYSMDEYGSYFRIQTSTWLDGVSYTNLYVLDMNLTMVGKLENLAPGENFHSSLFMGDRCYLVTFLKTDPLFVIDLSNATAPQVLGQLEIPGYSDYLHAYDATHLIGVGKNTADADQGSFAWYQGIKISLFDVSNVSNPIQLANYTIGDRGSDSPVLTDPKAFLFDVSKKLLVIPVSVAEINESEYPGGVPPYAYGDTVWQGAYVFDVSLFRGFGLEGNITHLENGMSVYEQAYWVKRSLYIGDVLYTISDRTIKMNSLVDLSQLGEISLS